MRDASVDDTALAGAVDTNFRECWTMLAGHVPGAQTAERGGLTLVRTGAAVAAFNPAFVTPDVTDPDAAITAAREFFGGAGVPFVLHVPSEHAAGTRAAAEAAGFHAEGRMPGMALHPIPEPPPPPDGLQIEVVAHGSLDDYAATVAAGFGMPADLVRFLFRASLLDAPSFTALLGTVRGEPVATSALVVTGDVAGVYNVATPARHRRKGYGEALSWAAVAEGKRRGASVAALQASEMGRPLYERMGFRTTIVYDQLVSPPFDA